MYILLQPDIQLFKLERVSIILLMLTGALALMNFSKPGSYPECLGIQITSFFQATTKSMLALDLPDQIQLMNESIR